MSVDVTVRMTPESEVHSVGDYVAVVWRIRHEKKRIKGDDGLTYTAEVDVRQGSPYLNFTTVSEYDDEFVEDEDSPVEGGFSLEQADAIVKELQLAIEYFKSLKV